MGSSQHIGYLQLEVENANVHAGQELTGVIHFKLDQGLQATFLSLKFKGKEFCQWTESRTERDRKGEDHRVTETYTGRAEIVRLQFPVFTFPGGFVESGHFSFPFKFTLPKDLPGKFHLKDGSTLADIKYKLTAQIDNVGKEVKKSTLEISVSQLLPQPIYSVSGVVTARLSTWFCCAQGTIQIKVDFNKNAYVPGETAEFVVALKNKSKLDISRVWGSLVHTLRLRDNGNQTNVSKRTLSTQEKVLRILPGEAAEGEESIRFQLPIQDFKGELQQTVSVQGSLIECAHTLIVHADMNGNCMCCGEQPDVEQNVVIYSSQQLSLAMPAIPIDWHPKVMPVAQFTLGHSFENQPSAPLLP